MSYFFFLRVLAIRLKWEQSGGFCWANVGDVVMCGGGDGGDKTQGVSIMMAYWPVSCFMYLSKYQVLVLVLSTWV